jgi:lycopene beta-cyclase
VWVDEFEAMGLAHCLDYVWPTARVFLDATPAGARTLARPYGRVNRAALKADLTARCVAQGVTWVTARATGCDHDDPRASTVRLSDGATLRARLVLDATGHARALVRYDAPFDPGYQAAYGVVADVEAHPFAVDAMLFMDWRDDHAAPYPPMRAANEAVPTFLYAMPFSPTSVFLEETSLVARPAVAFDDLKQRLNARLAHLGVKVTAVHEEEYCLIPMGGVLPALPQRVLGIGGTGGQVHPSTGYMVARALGAAPGTGDAVCDALADVLGVAPGNEGGPSPPSAGTADAAAARVWATLWPLQRLRQREFFAFGMDVLLRLNLAETRQFFAAFFSLSDFHWQGFLSSRLSFGELIVFGLSLFAKSTNAARADLLVKGVPGLAAMLVGLARTVGAGPKRRAG